MSSGRCSGARAAMESPPFPVECRAPVSAPSGRRILLTRDREDCAAWAAELEALGALPVVFPCIECRDIDTPGLRHRLAEELRRARWLAFTSRRGVAAVVKLLGGGSHAAIPEAVRVAAVGPATARAAAGTFARVDLAGGPDGTAASLGAALVPLLALGDRVLIAVAENAGRSLEEAIRAAGRAWTRLDVYRTFPSPPRVHKAASSSLGADNVFLASPSAVAGFVNRVHLDNAPGIFTIGPSTTEAARAAGLEVTAEAPRPGLRGLLEAMRCAT